MVISIVAEKSAWLIENNAYSDLRFTYPESPAALVPALKDLAPDYLIDLNEKRVNRRFKNRLKVLDFTISSKQDGWLAKTFEKLAVFDISDDFAGPDYLPDAPNPDWLPSSFRKGYLIISLDGDSQIRPLNWEKLITLANMIEKPLVITGERQHRPLADLIAKQVGCTVYPACGDFSDRQTASLLGGSAGVLAFDPFWRSIAESLRKPVVTHTGNTCDLVETAAWMRKCLTD